MTTVGAVLAAARRDIGYREGPGNDTKFGTWYGMNKVAWCAIWVNYVFGQALALPLVPKTAYTPTMAQWFRDRGRFGGAPRPGAVVFFDFPGDGVNRISHVGIVEAVNRDGSIVTIEGNTTAGVGGSQRDGGGVWRRTRKVGIVGYGYPDYLGTAPAAPSAARPPLRASAARPILREGATGDVVVALQGWLNTTFPAYSNISLSPRRYGPQTIGVVREWQRRSGIAVDGVFGPQSWAEAKRQGLPL